MQGIAGVVKSGNKRAGYLVINDSGEVSYAELSSVIDFCIAGYFNFELNKNKTDIASKYTKGLPVFRTSQFSSLVGRIKAGCDACCLSFSDMKCSNESMSCTFIGTAAQFSYMQERNTFGYLKDNYRVSFGDYPLNCIEMHTGIVSIGAYNTFVNCIRNGNAFCNFDNTGKNKYTPDVIKQFIEKLKCAK